tara:strand:- start:6301 stop:6882 length:582 start_codon:yes stop_codon:yes gene_type:complete
MVGIGLGMGVHFVTEPIAEVVPDVGWLKVTFNNDQSAVISGIERNNTLTSHTEEEDDYWQVDYKLYLQNVTGEEWDDGSDDDDPVSTFTVYGGIGDGGNAVVQDDLNTYSSGNSSGTAASYTNQLRLYWPVADDRPKAGAVFWLKDLVLKVYGTAGGLKATYTSDFTGDINGWTVIGSTVGTPTVEFNQEFLS